MKKILIILIIAFITGFFLIKESRKDISYNFNSEAIDVIESFSFENKIKDISIDKPMPFRLNNKWALISPEKEFLTEFKYDVIDPKYYDLYLFKKDGKWGFLDKDGKEVIKEQFEVRPRYYPIKYKNFDYHIVTGDFFQTFDKNFLFSSQSRTLEKIELPKFGKNFDFFTSEKCKNNALVIYNTGRVSLYNDLNVIYGSSSRITQDNKIVFENIYTGKKGIMDCHENIILSAEKYVQFRPHKDGTLAVIELNTSNQIQQSEIINIDVKLGLNNPERTTSLELSFEKDENNKIITTNYINKNIHSGEILMEKKLEQPYTINSNFPYGNGILSFYNNKRFQGYLDQYGNELFFGETDIDEGIRYSKNFISNKEKKESVRNDNDITLQNLLINGFSVKFDSEYYDYNESLLSNLNNKKAIVECNNIEYDNCRSWYFADKFWEIKGTDYIVVSGSGYKDPVTIYIFKKNTHSKLEFIDYIIFGNSRGLTDVRLSGDDILFTIQGGFGDECYYENAIDIISIDKNFVGEYINLFTDNRIYDCGNGGSIISTISDDNLILNYDVYNCGNNNYDGCDPEFEKTQIFSYTKKQLISE